MQNRFKISLMVVAEFFARPAWAASTLSSLETTAMSGYGGPDKIPFKDLSIAGMVGQIISVALSLIGVIMFVYMVYGGFLWMTAGGNQRKVEEAQGIIKNTILGLLVIVMAYAITNFVLDQLVK